MAKIKADDLIELFERMARENWRYEWGAAREGEVDCSGALVYAYDMLGGPDIEHGSNSIARKRCGPLQHISAAKPGWACFKVRAWAEDQAGNRWYGTEPGDVYHVGIMGRDGLVLNAQGTEKDFEADNPTAGWDLCAPLAAVDYTGTGVESVAVYQAQVTTEKDPLQIRAAPVNGRVIAKAPRGALVDVLGESVTPGWMRVNYDGVSGYASGAYLTPLGSAQAGADAGDSSGSQAEDSGTAITTLYNARTGACITLVGAWRIAQD